MKINKIGSNLHAIKALLTSCSFSVKTKRDDCKLDYFDVVLFSLHDSACSSNFYAIPKLYQKVIYVIALFKINILIVTMRIYFFSFLANFHSC